MWFQRQKCIRIHVCTRAHVDTHVRVCKGEAAGRPDCGGEKKQANIQESKLYFLLEGNK